ncbi:MAG: hypothetical protein FIA99_04270 [Ruminiclostridium sp.]|nr:hypothetical protein [Ruminiclostridium sp.]
MNQQNMEYQKAVQIIAELLMLDSDTKQKISTYIQSYGIGHFLDNLEAYDLPRETNQKFQALRIVLLKYAKYVQNLEPAEGGGDEQYE